MDKVYLSYNQTYVKHLSSGKKVESVRIPTVPQFFELSYTDVFSVSDGDYVPIGDSLILDGDIFKKIIRSFTDNFNITDVFEKNLRKSLTLDIRSTFDLNDNITSRIPITIVRGFSSTFNLDDDILTDIIDVIDVNYTETFNLEDNISYEI